DITADAIAKAFGVPLARDKDTEAALTRHYGKEKLNAARLKMADFPKGARLITNPVSTAPGFAMENVFVFAGIPSIMRAMFAGVKPQLKGGRKMLSRTLSAYVSESAIAEKLSAIQDRHPEVEIGSYPFFRDDRIGTSLVARGTDLSQLAKAGADIKAMLLGVTTDISEEEAA
ncbi:MAG: competence/damage-inducible protein A, partial [Pseudomonadota bacterium]|nr:competence/damage-inducible protein A [Pseudomonadota bacterium]